MKHTVLKSAPDGRPVRLRAPLDDRAGSPHTILLRKHPAAGDDPETPWYLRVPSRNGVRSTWKRVGDAPALGDAIRNARIVLRELRERPDEFADFLQTVARRKTITVARLIEQYAAAGYPDRYRRPRPTGSSALRDETRHLANVLEYFGPKHPESIKPSDCETYLEHVRARLAAEHSGATRIPEGLRTVELDLTSLSNCFTWATRKGIIRVNPLADRGTLRDPNKIDHHRLYQPESDEELHRLCGWLMTHEDPSYVISGARVMFHALTGLRPGEAAALRWHGPHLAPGTPGQRVQGILNDTPCELMRVWREKRGNNPSILITQTLDAFLKAWRQWTDAHLLPLVAHPLFPGINPARDNISDHLQAAAAATGSPANRFGQTRRTGHALRAYYVSVRRSQGISDLVIASELGQGSGARLVAQVYGDRADMPTGRLDWLPSSESGVPIAWTILNQTANLAKIIPLAA